MSAEPPIGLDQIPGEGKGELAFSGRRGIYTFYVTHEYEGAPWGWIVVEGTKELVAFGDAVDHPSALRELAAEMDRICPPPPPPRAGGLLGLVERLIWGA